MVRLDGFGKAPAITYDDMKSSRSWPSHTSFPLLPPPLSSDCTYRNKAIWERERGCGLMNMHEMEIGCHLTMQSLKTSVCVCFFFFNYVGVFNFFLSDTRFAFIKKKVSRWEGKAGPLVTGGCEHQFSCTGRGKVFGSSTGSQCLDPCCCRFCCFLAKTSTCGWLVPINVEKLDFPK